ncbi:methyltransferase domain-containing protein [Luteolibacter marinus]|uniref:methyltransferase domain-containing protein n=1 Tax=Luteolibacter marinus TaxID=2776705 RepID=UPI0018680052|nr:methyltransferase domain-containing protein [Luteolibacter marinus]
MTNWEERWQRSETPWEKGRAAPPLEELLDDPGCALYRARRVLVPGCGSGNDVRELARRGIGATGLDLSPTAIARARCCARAGDEDYLCGDLFDGVWRGDREFDAVWEHTCFCAIDPGLRPAYAQVLADLLPAGGVLAGVFFLTPWDPGEDEQGPPFGATRAEITGLFEPWFELRKEQVPARSYPGREGREWLTVFARRELPNPGVADPVPSA